MSRTTARWREAYTRDPTRNGKFASLTVRFRNRVRPKRVVIEHHSVKSSTAMIRDFRVIGYQDENYDDPLHLGTFRYLHDDDPVQEFWISNTNTVEIQSVTLAIDSAYQNDFACLYRFSVMEE